ncbi:MAG: TonB-dependent receptor plug domain-containing protein, partial [Gemmatimonadaceae bacterium]
MTNLRRIARRSPSALLGAIAISGTVAASSGLLLTPRAAGAQARTGTIILRVTAANAPLSGAAVATETARGVTDQAGMATFKLPTGEHKFRVAPVGFRPESLAVFVGVGTTNVTVPVQPVPAMSAVLEAPITAKREDRQASSMSPTYVEVSGREALDAQLDRSPGTINELLDRVSGVRVQTLSAGSGGVGIRIRGMPARYTKLLSDGLPLLGATPEGQDPLQVSALDLGRVEVVPGVTSALYGPTSLSGSVNLVSAPPTSPSEVIVNGTTLKASDIALFQTHTFSPEWAATLLTGRHYESAADPDGDGWAEVNGYKRVVVQPRVYWSRSPTSSWFMTGGWTAENRRSGTFDGARLPDFNTFSDDADTRRGDAGTIGRIELDTNTLLTARASMTREWRTRWFGDRRERDRRNEIFGDVSLTKSVGENVMIGGVALDRDQYAALDTRGDDYRYTTPALYAEDTWSPERWFAVTSGARLDLQSEFGDFVSPRVSVLLRPSDAWNVRLSRANG